MNVLLVDDDRELLELLRFALRRAGLDTIVAHDSPTALHLFDAEHPDVVVLDVNLGAWNGFELLQELRRGGDVPVIMLTAHGAEEDKIRGLELGADDYMTKPFSHRELVARIRAQLRRRGRDMPEQTTGPRVYDVGPLHLNVAEHVVKKDGQPVSLTVTEFRLLHALMLQAGTVVPTRTLLKRVWRHDDPGDSDVVRVTVHRLRRKLEDDPAHPRYLQTVPGVGVMLTAADAEPVPTT